MVSGARGGSEPEARPWQTRAMPAASPRVRPGDRELGLSWGLRWNNADRRRPVPGRLVGEPGGPFAPPGAVDAAGNFGESGPPDAAAGGQAGRETSA